MALSSSSLVVRCWGGGTSLVPGKPFRLAALVLSLRLGLLQGFFGFSVAGCNLPRNKFLVVGGVDDYVLLLWAAAALVEARRRYLAVGVSFSWFQSAPYGRTSSLERCLDCLDGLVRGENVLPETRRWHCSWVRSLRKVIRTHLKSISLRKHQSVRGPRRPIT